VEHNNARSTNARVLQAKLYACCEVAKRRTRIHHTIPGRVESRFVTDVTFGMYREEIEATAFALANHLEVEHSNAECPQYYLYSRPPRRTPSDDLQPPLEPLGCVIATNIAETSLTVDGIKTLSTRVLGSLIAHGHGRAVRPSSVRLARQRPLQDRLRPDSRFRCIRRASTSTRC
jgi:hypothetical protein